MAFPWEAMVTDSTLVVKASLAKIPPARTPLVDDPKSPLVPCLRVAIKSPKSVKLPVVENSAN